MDWTIFWAAAGVLVAVLGPLGKILFDEWKRRRSASGELTIESADWVIERGLTYEALLMLLLGLDYSSLPGLTALSSGTAETKAPVFEKSPETWGLVVFRETVIVGYWSCFSLSKKLVARLEQGAMLDSEITVAEIHSVQEPIAHKLYFEMFGVHPSFGANEKAIFRLLVRSLADFAARSRAAGIRVETIYANGFSERGAALCRAFGLRPFVGSKQGGDVYRLDDIQIALARLERLATKGGTGKLVR